MDRRATPSYHVSMFVIARGIQVAGLLMTGYAAIAAFSLDMSEGEMFTWGIGGFAVFYLGTSLFRGNE